MRTENRRTTSVSLGVANTTVGTEITSAMMGSASPQPGAESEITDHVTLRYLRAFDASETAKSDQPSVWLDFSFRFDRGAEANVITDWLIGILGKAEGKVVLRFDNKEVALETELLRKEVGNVLRLSY